MSGHRKRARGGGKGSTRSPAEVAGLRSRRAGRRSSKKAIVAVTACAVAIPALAVAGAATAGIPLLPLVEEPAPPAAAPAAPPGVVVATGTLAGNLVADLLRSGPGPGWRPANGITRAPGTPFDYACRVVGPPAAAVAADRSFQDARGQQVTVQVRAYGAGLGAVAMDRLAARVQACPGRDSRVTAATYSDGSRSGIAGTVRPDGAPHAVASLTWRRGDVLLSVVAPGRTPSSLSSVAASVDAAALALLRPVCADLAAGATESVRTPWADRGLYAGWFVPEGVTAPPQPLPAPPAGIAPAPLDRVVDPLPLVTLPNRPADPVWPPALPTAVASPQAPLPPGPQPTATMIPIQQRDDVGPGCGWAFTGQAAPVVDDAVLIATREATISQAQNNLDVLQNQWGQSVVAYWAAAAQYDLAAAAFRAYATQVSSVAAQWQQITDARNAYATSLTAYQQAQADLAAYLAARATAQAAYDLAVAACAAAPTPVATTPTPATTSPGPGPAASGPPAAPPSGSPTATAPPPTALATCPPPRPAVLDQPAPTLLPSPLPPADPRPGAATSPGPSSPTR